MRILSIVALLTLTLTLPAFAGDAGLTVTQRTHPKAGQSLTLDASIVGAGAMQANAKPMLVGNGSANKIGVVLNCENDGIINLANTLLISPGDFVGNIFAAPAVPNPFHVREVTLGFADFGQVYPATALVEFYEDNGGGGFDFVTAFTVNIPSSPGAGTLYTVDISAFNIVLSNDLLTLYADDAPSEGGYMVPTGDNSPRCFNGSNVCSVHLPAGSGSLFIYGLGDPGCPPNNILNLDLTHELLVDEIPVSTVPSSFGEVKSKFED